MRQMRKAVGISQAKLAQALGVSCPLIREIEQGRRRANEAIALIAMAKFGVWHECIRDHTETATDLDGAPYTRETWQKFQGCVSAPMTIMEREDYLSPFRIMFDAAGVCGKVKVLAALLSHLYYRSIVDIHGLSDAIDTIVTERSKTQPRPTDEELSHKYRGPKVLTYGHLRRSRVWAESFDFKDDPARSDHEVFSQLPPVERGVWKLFGKPYPASDSIQPSSESARARKRKP